jgi:hypothetical protein
MTDLPCCIQNDSHFPQHNRGRECEQKFGDMTVCLSAFSCGPVTGLRYFKLSQWKQFETKKKPFIES